MNNKFMMVILTVLLLVLPGVLAEVKVQLGEPYFNIEDLSEIEFTTHSNYYELCSLDNTTIPVLINNKNKFSDIFRFEVNKEYASLPVKSAVLRSGKSSILPLTINPPIGMEENTTLVLDIITKKEGLKRSVIIRINVEECYLFDLKLDKKEDELCGCGKETYNLVLQNRGKYADVFTLSFDAPEWINYSLTNETVELYGGQEKEVNLEANPPCDEKGAFTVNAKAVSENSKVVLEDKLEITVLPKDECYYTIISASNVEMDYFGKNVLITIKNKGVKDADYSLSIEGVGWYTLSQNSFSLKPNGEKIINLALYPDKSVAEGEYNLDIKAKTGEQEFTKSITIRLRSKGTFFEKVRFYINYFRYYTGLGVVLLIIILLLMVIVKKRIEEKKVKEKPKEKAEIKEIKKVERKVEEKRITKKVETPKKEIGWLLPFILYLLFLALLALLVYSTFKYKPYYEKALNFISGLFTKYMIPYAFYFRYAVAGICVLIVLLLVIDFFMKRSKKKGKKKKEEKIEKEKEPKKEIIEEKKVGKKIVKKRKLELFKHVYIILVILLIIAIACYAIYRFLGKSMLIDKLGLIKNFIKGYLPYFIAGILILVILILFFKKKEKKIKEQKVAKKVKRKANKKFIKNLIITIVGLIILSGIAYSFVYYNLYSYIAGFFVVYYPYILMGIGILVILTLILQFHNKKIQ